MIHGLIRLARDDRCHNLLQERLPLLFPICLERVIDKVVVLPLKHRVIKGMYRPQHHGLFLFLRVKDALA
jgi:hypothetical protein